MLGGITVGNEHGTLSVCTDRIQFGTRHLGRLPMNFCFLETTSLYPYALLSRGSRLLPFASRQNPRIRSFYHALPILPAKVGSRDTGNRVRQRENVVKFAERRRKGNFPFQIRNFIIYFSTWIGFHRV